MRPASITAWTDAENVQAGTRQSVPVLAPAAFKARLRPTVALEMVLTWAGSRPNRAARRVSNASQSGPKFEYQRAVSICSM